MNRKIINIEAIKAAVTMQEVVNGILGYSLDSRNRCACPVHQGKNKNFSVKGESAKCWSTCDQSWDKIGLIMAARKVSFTEALTIIADYAGISLQYADGRTEKPRFFKRPPQSVLKPEPKYDLIPEALFKRSLKHDNRNHFFGFLQSTFGEDIARSLAQNYQLGTSKYRPGACIFWQVDQQQKVRTGKVMVYDPATGKRRRDIPPQWVHRLSNLHKDNFKLAQCLFGEHLLQALNPETPIALVESEKTAMIMAGIKPDVCWLACGSMSGLTTRQCEALKGRRTILYPDLDAQDKWTKDALKLNEQGFKFVVSDLLSAKASEQDYLGKFDLADYFLKQRDDTAGFLVLNGVPVFW